MTFEELTKANEAIRTTVIEKKNKKTGVVTKKDYAEVFQKIKAFRMLYPDGQITTEFQFISDGVVLFTACVKDDEGKVLGMGTAYEKEGSSFINETSYIENCETSAVGRALSMCGIGIDYGVASYEEVANAMKQQETVEAEVVKKTPREKKKADTQGFPSRSELIKIAKSHYPDGSANLKALLETFNAESIDKLTDDQLKAIYSKFGGR